RRIHTLSLHDALPISEQRRNLDHAADHDRNEGEHAEKRDVALDLLVLLGEAHFADSYSAGTATIGRSASGSYGASRSGASARWRSASVSQPLATHSTAPARWSTPPIGRSRYIGFSAATVSTKLFTR